LSDTMAAIFAVALMAAAILGQIQVGGPPKGKP
jgi:hypothetical protein